MEKITQTENTPVHPLSTMPLLWLAPIGVMVIGAATVGHQIANAILQVMVDTNSSEEFMGTLLSISGFIGAMTSLFGIVLTLVGTAFTIYLILSLPSD